MFDVLAVVPGDGTAYSESVLSEAVVLQTIIVVTARSPVPELNLVELASNVAVIAVL
jgi:hypothetical protein